jgi:hypothetical protein
MNSTITMIPTEDLALYQQLVDSRAMEKSTDILPNAGEKHAAIAMSKLFDTTSESVKMVLGGFVGPVSAQPNYIESLKRCIENKVKFQVISLTGFNKSAEAYLILDDAKSRGFDITLQEGSEYLSKVIPSKHFAIFDNDKFRFETDIDKHVAWFSFNDKANASSLSSIFDLGLKN